MGRQELERLLARGAIDLVVFGLPLPGANGLALCRKLSRPGGPAIIILSSLSEAVDRIGGLVLGADDYLAKPCNPRELLARVRAGRSREDRVRLRQWRVQPRLSRQSGAARAGWA